MLSTPRSPIGHSTMNVQRQRMRAQNAYCFKSSCSLCLLPFRWEHNNGLIIDPLTHVFSLNQQEKNTQNSTCCLLSAARNRAETREKGKTKIENTYLVQASCTKLDDRLWLVCVTLCRRVLSFSRSHITMRDRFPPACQWINDSFFGASMRSLAHVWWWQRWRVDGPHSICPAHFYSRRTEIKWKMNEAKMCGAQNTQRRRWWWKVHQQPHARRVFMLYYSS